jgi:hypothetical protein
MVIVGRRRTGYAGLHLELGVGGHLLAAVPGQRPSQLIRQGRHRLGQCVFHGDRAVASQGWAVLDRVLVPVPLLAGQVDEHGEPRGAFDDGADG